MVLAAAGWYWLALQGAVATATGLPGSRSPVSFFLVRDSFLTLQKRSS